ncbi:hypothetical protein [Alsobacter sp. SYSU BS001988]
MVTTLKDALAHAGVLDHVALPAALDRLLARLIIVGPFEPPREGAWRGRVILHADADERPLAEFGEAVSLPGETDAELEADATGFRLRLAAAVGPALLITGSADRPAALQAEPDAETPARRGPAPEELIAGLGFAVAGHPARRPPPLAEDLAVLSPAGRLAGQALGDDAYRAALLALGVESRPAAHEPRLSRLWTRDDGGPWLFCGLLLEAPWPVHVSGGLEIGALALEMGAGGAAVRFDILRRDGAGARLLFAASAPFAVVTRERISGPRPHRPPKGGGGRFGGDGHGGGPPFRFFAAKLVLHAIATRGAAVAPIEGRMTLPVSPDFTPRA